MVRHTSIQLYSYDFTLSVAKSSENHEDVIRDSEKVLLPEGRQSTL